MDLKESTHSGAFPTLKVTSGETWPFPFDKFNATLSSALDDDILFQAFWKGLHSFAPISCKL